jgi:hypothetical protein
MRSFLLYHLIERQFHILFSTHSVSKSLLTFSFILFSSIHGLSKPPERIQIPKKPPGRVIRTCCLFGADVKISGVPFVRKTDVIGMDEIRNHCFMGDCAEGNGIIYTKKGGFIDLGHLRDCADWTAYLYVSLCDIRDSGKSDRIDLGNEGGSKWIQLSILSGLSDSELMQISGKIAYELSLWHEIATSFGSSYVPLVPERYSGFSPEDLYSNLLGTKLGIRAIESIEDYNTAMTRAIAEALQKLEVVPGFEENLNLMMKAEGLWWESEVRLPGRRFLIKRYYDAEKMLSPWLLPYENTSIGSPIMKFDLEYSVYYDFLIKVNFRIPIRTQKLECETRIISVADFEALISYLKLEEETRNER